MADVELVVKISEEMYKKLLNKGAIMCLSGYEGIIANGTSLPKGHGRLGDLDALEDYIKIDADEWDRYALAYVENAPTIIEADKE